jgi:hypothetical protein
MMTGNRCSLSPEYALWAAPRPAFVHCLHLGRSAADIAKEFDVSEQLVKYRTGITGINRQSRVRR